MNRRSSDQRGHVRFPVDDPRYTNSGEGGMFVRLVVEDAPRPANWMVCCGGVHHITADESYLRDDNREPPADDAIDPSGLSPEEAHKALLVEQERAQAYVAHHFPDMDAYSVPSHRRYLSIPYLATLTIGSAGWSGWDEQAGEYWHCTYDDLTDEGKALYDNLKKLYDGCAIRLQTWLDT